MATKSRSIPLFGLNTEKNFPRLTSNGTVKDGYSRRRGAQVTVSEGHPHTFIGSGLRDIGGPFYSRSVWLDYTSHRDVSFSYSRFGGSTSVAHGYILPVKLPTFSVKNGRIFSGSLPIPEYASSDEELELLGTKAIANCSPLNTQANLAVAIGELFKEGLPSLMGTLLKKKGGLAGEYLNYTFGIAPLIREINSVARAIIDLDKHVNQLYRDSGKLVRRKFAFDTVTSTSSTSTPGVLPDIDAISAYMFVGGMTGARAGIQKIDTTITKKQWFEGAFTYHFVPPVSGDQWDRLVKGALHVLGLRLSVSTFWDLMPWSWLIDWHVNAGDIITNVTNAQQYGQVMPYGYMMEKTIVRTEYTLTGPAFKPTIPGGPFSLVTLDVTKKRIQASPYGFGVSWDGYSPYQLSVLAALGITRA